MGILDTLFGNKKKKIEAALQKEPTVERVLELAGIYKEEKDIAAALRLLRAWSKKFNDEKLRSALHEAELLDRTIEIQSLEARIKEAPNSLNYSRLATLKIKSGDLEGALKVCQTSLEKYPQFNAGAHQCLGDIFLIKEDYAKAASEYELVIKDDPNNVQVIKNVCEIYIFQGKLNKALSYLEDLIKKNPGDQALKDMLSRARAGEQLAEEKEELLPPPAPTPVAAPPVQTPKPAPESIKPRSPKIRVTDPQGKIIDIDLVKDEFVVGRQKDVDLSIDDGKNFISRKHSAFKKVGGLWQISDLGSGNGTFLNGTKLSAPQNLKNMDVVKVGYYSIQFLSDDVATVVPDSEMTMIEDSDATIVGQEFSYFNKPAEVKTQQISVEAEVERVAKISGVRYLMVINNSGFPVHCIANDKALNEQVASALMAHVFNLAKEKTDQLDIKQVHSCDILTTSNVVSLYGKNGFVVCVICSLDCKKGQIDSEIKSLLQGL